MSMPFIGMIRLVGFQFAPVGYAFCDGRLVPISQNPALFSLLGTFYGGDGVNMFGLPDLRGRVPIHQGANATNTYAVGQSGGVETVTLTLNQLPAHTHDPLIAGAGGSDVPSPNGARPASGGPDLYASTAPGAPTTMPLATSGGSSFHDNMAPFLVLNFVIALVGIFPSRN